MDKLEKIIQPPSACLPYRRSPQRRLSHIRQKVKKNCNCSSTWIRLSIAAITRAHEGVADLVQRLRNKPDDKLHLFS